MGRDRTRQKRGRDASTVEVPSVSAHLPRLVLEATQRSGADPRGLARRLGLDVDTIRRADGRVPLEKERCLWPEAAKATGDDLFGVRLATNPVAGNLDVFDYIWRNAPTVGDALSCAARYLPLLHDVAHLDLQEERETINLRYSFRGETAPLERHMAEYTFTSIIAAAQRATGIGNLGPLHVSFEHAPPTSHRALAAALSTPDIDFRAPACRMTLPKAALALPLIHADVSLGAILRRHADALLAARPRPATLREQIVDVLLRANGTRPPTLDEVARTLHVGARTLQRRLAAEDLHFHEVIELARQDSATRLLQHGATVAEVSERLRFSDVRAFRRAFIRWTGLTPQEYRNKHAPENR